MDHDFKSFKELFICCKKCVNCNIIMCKGSPGKWLDGVNQYDGEKPTCAEIIMKQIIE